MRGGDRRGRRRRWSAAAHRTQRVAPHCATSACPWRWRYMPPPTPSSRTSPPAAPAPDAESKPFRRSARRARARTRGRRALATALGRTPGSGPTLHRPSTIPRATVGRPSLDLARSFRGSAAFPSRPPVPLQRAGFRFPPLAGAPLASPSIPSLTAPRRANAAEPGSCGVSRSASRCRPVDPRRSHSGAHLSMQGARRRPRRDGASPSHPTTRSRALTTFGSNCVPPHRCSSSRASSIGIAARYGRSVVIAL